MNIRIDHIDIAKGISIILVAIHHSKFKVLFPSIVESMSLFRMPLFFFLSGIFFSVLQEPKFFLLKKTEALLKPYFSVLLTVVCISVLFYQGDFSNQLINIFIGNGRSIAQIDIYWWVPMWFLTHLFAVFCSTYILFKYLKFDSLPQISKWVGIAIVFAIGVNQIAIAWNVKTEIFNQELTMYGLPFSVDLLLVTTSYFIVGYLLKKQIQNFKPNFYWLLAAITSLIIVVLFTEAKISLNHRVYNEPFFATLGAISGIYIILSLSCFISSFNIIKKIILYIGSASLYILIFHGFVYFRTYNFLINHSPENILLVAVISLGFAIIIPLGIKWLVDKNRIISLFLHPTSLVKKSNKSN